MHFFFSKYYADANEAESWMREKMPLVSSQDYGRDESSAKVTLSAVSSIWHSCLLFELQNNETRVSRLSKYSTQELDFIKFTVVTVFAI